MSRSLPSVLRSFERDEQGAVAIVFGLMSVALLLAAGVSVDFARAVSMRARISQAVDAASLAAGRAMLEGKLSDAQIKTMAAAYFTTNVGGIGKMGSIDAPAITLNRTTGTVSINVPAMISMTISRVGGFKQMSIPVASTANYSQSDLEVAMALDTTGSMTDKVGGVEKIDALKSAFAKFADKIIPDVPTAGHKSRIAIAPYSAAINLGSYSGTASNFRSKDGCVTERTSGDYSDSNSAFDVKADSARDIDPTEGTDPKAGPYSYLCPSQQISALTDDKDTLVRTVNAFTAKGSTGGHFGVQWAWNLVSDQWSGVWGSDAAPASYGDVTKGKLTKAVVLMTDGIFNTSYHGSTSATQAVALCDAMKKKGVLVFTVGFGLGSDPTALKTLQSCATPGTGYFANANSASDLDAAFSLFASKLTALRISK